MSYVFPNESEDLDVMLSDSLHTITVGAVTQPCFYDNSAQEGSFPGSDAAQVLQMETASIKTDHFPDLAEGDQVGITEKETWQQDYTILRILKNGAMSELLLQRV